jgi:outer membrane receptor protein involved in Fe transport
VSATIFGTVQGIVHDPQHRPVQGATVVLRALASQWQQSTTTNEDGEFRVAAVRIGDYTVTVTAPGFGAKEQQVRVTSDAAPILHFALEIATVSQNVEVSAAPEQVNPRSSTTQNLISDTQIAHAPGADRANSLAMITNFVPGAYMIHDQLHIRGGHQVTWMVDGVPVPNTNVASNVGPQFDPKDIEYMEVQRGGLSSEQGDRTYGVFNVATRSGFERNREGEIVAGYGSFNETNDQISFGSHTQRFGYYASLSGNRSDLGLETPSPEVIHDMAAGLSAFGSFIFNADARNQLRLVTSVRGDHYQVPNTPEQQAAGIRDVDSERDSFVNFSWVHTVGGAALLTVSPFFHYNRANYQGGTSDTPIIPQDDRSSNYLGLHTTLSTTWRQHNAKIGFDVFGEQQSTLFGLTATDGSGLALRQRERVHGDVAALFLEDQYRVRSWLTLNGGVRLTRYSGGMTETAADPRVGAALQLPGLKWVARGFYGRYYQPPPLSTIGGPLLAFAVEQGFGFLPLRGERDEQYEYGLTIPFAGWSVDVDRFRTNAHNFFDHDVLGNSNIFFPLTIDRARIHGTEVSVRSPRLWRNAEFHLAYSHQYAEAQGGVTGGLSDFAPLEDEGWFLLDHDQRDTLSTGVQISLPRRSWASTNVSYGSGFVDSDGPQHLPSHTTFDLSAGKQFGERWSANVSALNLANRRFMLDDSNTFGGTHWINPRQVLVEVRYRFRY